MPTIRSRPKPAPDASPQLLYRKNPDVHKLEYPLLASAKLDGFRCFITKDGPRSRTLKPIPNREIREALSDPRLYGLDGELIVGDAHDPQVFNISSSYIRSHDKRGGDWTFYAFDRWDVPDMPFHRRFISIENGVFLNYRHPQCGVVNHCYVLDPDHLLEYEQICLDAGYEGLILRHPTASYKYGRTTATEGSWKYKRFIDGEAHIIGMVPLMHNTNEAFISETGHQKRSKAQEGLVKMNLMGALILQDLETKTRFECGTGFTAADRAFWYRNWRTLQRGSHNPAIVTYKKFLHGEKDKPRHPVFKGWRPSFDL
jgi:DNA ligase-1